MSSSFDHFKGEIILIAKLKGKPGSGDKMAELLDKIHKSANSEKETGCLTYRVVRIDDEIVVFEKYVNADAIKFHLATDEFKALGGAFEDLLIGGKPELGFYEELF